MKKLYKIDTSTWTVRKVEGDEWPALHSDGETCLSFTSCGAAWAKLEELALSRVERSTRMVQRQRLVLVETERSAAEATADLATVREKRDGFAEPLAIDHDGGLLARMRSLESDHAPDGWPAVQMRDITTLCAAVEHLSAALREAEALAMDAEAKAARYVWLRDNPSAKWRQIAISDGCTGRRNYRARAAPGVGVDARGGTQEDRGRWHAMSGKNPWRLSTREADTMDAICVCGLRKVVAARLGIAGVTVQDHLKSARVKMRAPNTLVQAVMWDRFRRSEESA